MSALESDCKKFEPLLDALRDGELGSDERQAVEQHAASCVACQGQLSDIERVVATLRALPRVKPPRDFSDDIEALIAKQPAGKVFTLRPVIWGSIGAAAVAAAAAVIVFKLTPGFGPANVVAVRESSGSQRQRVQPGVPKQQTQERTTEVAHEKDDDGAPAPLQAVPIEHRTLGTRPLVATTNGETQPITQPVEDPLLSRGQHNMPAGGQTVGTGKPPQTNELQESPSPAAVPQQTRPKNTLYGRTAVAEVDEDDPFTSGAAVVAIATGDQTSITEEIGLETDEDGLYAIKM